MCILKGSEFRGRMFFLGAWALVLCPRVDDFHTHRLMAGPLAESGLLGGPAYFPGGNAQHSPGTWGHRWAWEGSSVRPCCTCWRETTRTWRGAWPPEGATLVARETEYHPDQNPTGGSRMVCLSVLSVWVSGYCMWKLSSDGWENI